MSGGKLVVWIIFLLVPLPGYLIPGFVAAQRRHRDATAILLLNIFLGWTLIGWVVALVWAAKSQSPASDPVVVTVQNAPGGQVTATAAPAPARPTAEFCPQCGKRRDGTLSFCRSCGASLA